ncbi:MAG: LysR family transcriptional regulator, partial [Ramlibacter sp.]|nr:LysR family transcriptional regulator [Ramlibacter sp.]
LWRDAPGRLNKIAGAATRVRRVATGWEPQFTVALDSVISLATVMDLVQAFYELQPPTRLRLRNEALSGTLEALTSGQADLAIGIPIEPGTAAGLQSRALGELAFVYAVAPHHPLANAKEPLADELLQQHRVVAAADSVQRGSGISVGLMAGQDVLTVPNMHAKLEAQLRGLGGGFVPEPMASAHVQAGRLVIKQVARPDRTARLHYAWRTPRLGPGRALQWWLSQLERESTRQALLTRHEATWSVR